MGLLPAIAQDLAISTGDAGLVISAYALGVVFGAPIVPLFSGKMTDKQLICMVLVVFLLGNVVVALGQTIGAVVLGRILTALAHGVYFGVGSLVAIRLVPQHFRSTAISILFLGLTVANIVGVPLGSYIGNTMDWRFTFGIICILSTVALIFIASTLPDNSERLPDQPWTLLKSAFINSKVRTGLLTTALGFGGTFATLTYIAPILIEAVSFTHEQVSFALLSMGLGLVFGNIVGGRLADWHLSRALPITVGSLTLCLLIMPALLVNFYGALLSTFLLGFSAFSTVSPLQTVILNNTPEAVRATTASFNIGAFNLGNAIGAFCVGLAINYGMPSIWTPIVSASMPLTALVIINRSQK